jgi:hypothetical protein
MHKYGSTEKQALRSKIRTGKLLYSATELGISGQIPSGQSTYTESGASLDSKSINSISIEQEGEEFFASLPRVEKHVSNLEKKLQKEEAKLEENPLDIAQNKAVLELKAEMEAYSNYVNQVKEQPVETIESEQEIEKQAVLSSEIDQNGLNFIQARNGSTVFGEIKAESGLTPAPIKLSSGNKSYGLEHIEERRGEQIRQAGFSDVVEFVEFVAQNYNRIQEGVNIDKQPNNTYLIQITDKHNNTLYVELSNDGSYWNVNSGGVFRGKYGDNLKTVWSASETQNGKSVSDNTLRSSTQADNLNDPNGTISNTDNKDNTEVFGNQAKDEKFLSTSQPTETIEQPIEQTQTKTPEQSEAELAIEEAHQARRKALLDEVDRLSELFNTPVIIHESIEAEVHPDYIKKDGVRSAENGYNDQMLIHRFYGAVEIDGKMYRVKTTINEYRDESRTATPYSYEVTKIELLEESNSPTELNSPNSEIGGLSIETTKLLKGIEKSYDKGKYLLDESENDTPLFRFIGERGASHLENANKVLDELRVAREMETTTKDAKTIRLVTGWKRGVDGKWRFEQPDEKIVNIAALAKNLKSTLDELIGVELIQTYPELADIKSKAVKDGTFMKAPNGNPTNLNERQWLQVRTPEFKEWFGDTTENDPTLLYYNRYILTPPSNVPQQIKNTHNLLAVSVL